MTPRTIGLTIGLAILTGFVLADLVLIGQERACLATWADARAATVNAPDWFNADLAEVEREVIACGTDEALLLYSW